MKNRISHTKNGFRNTIAILIVILSLIIGIQIIYTMFVCPIMEFIMRCNTHTLDVIFVLFSIFKIFAASPVGGSIIFLGCKFAELIGTKEI